MAYLPAWPRSCAASRAAAICAAEQAGEVVLGFEHQGIGLLVGEHVLAECGAERRQPLADRGEPLLVRGVEAGAGAAEGHVVALQHARLLGREAELAAALPQRLDAGEEAGMELDAVAVRREARRHLALDRLDGVVGVGAGEAMEHRGDVRQRPPAALQRRDRVGEARRLGLAGDRLDLGELLGHRRARRRA